MSNYHHNPLMSFDANSPSPASANDNVVWTADLHVAARAFSEIYHRHRKVDPRNLSYGKRAYLNEILATSLDALLLCWKDLSAR